MSWTVERWGGNANHKRRVVFIGSENLARERYQKIYTDLRQGIVELFDDEGRSVKRFGAGAGRAPGNIIEF